MPLQPTMNTLNEIIKKLLTASFSDLIVLQSLVVLCGAIAAYIGLEE